MRWLGKKPKVKGYVRLYCPPCYDGEGNCYHPDVHVDLLVYEQ